MNLRPKSTRLTVLDRRMLDRLQQDIPFVKRPWRVMARQLNINEPVFLERLESLKKNGTVRRIAATFDPKKVGFVSTLVAAKVAPKNIDKVAGRLNTYDEITHNYRRDSEFNLWFTIVAPDLKAMARIIRLVKRDKDIYGVLELPATRVFKIKVNLPLAKEARECR